MKLPQSMKAALGVAAITLLLATPAISPVYAYFTDQSYASGGLPVKAKPNTDIREWYGEKVKHVTIFNKEESVPVFVRARVYAYAEYLDTVEGSGWSGPNEDGWYYYQDSLEPGEEANELLVKIKFPAGKETIGPDGSVIEEYDQTGENFNVIVVYEATPADDQLTPETADWSMRVNGGE